MKIYQSRLFEKKVQKMTKAEKEALDREVRNIAENINFDEEKKGDLKGVFVHKFKIKTNLYLLAYRKMWRGFGTGHDWLTRKLLS